MMAIKHWEITQREYDKKWIRWELMDSRKLGETATWTRFKWVITDVWDKEPKKLMHKSSFNLKGIEERLDGKRIYVYES